MKKNYKIGSRLDILKCRLASAARHGLDYVTILVSAFILVSNVKLFTAVSYDFS
jgi:hypothetical protein